MEKGKNVEGGGQQEQIKAVPSYQPHFLGAHQMKHVVSFFSDGFVGIRKVKTIYCKQK